MWMDKGFQELAFDVWRRSVWVLSAFASFGCNDSTDSKDVDLTEMAGAEGMAFSGAGGGLVAGAAGGAGGAGGGAPPLGGGGVSQGIGSGGFGTTLGGQAGIGIAGELGVGTGGVSVVASSGGSGGMTTMPASGGTMGGGGNSVDAGTDTSPGGTPPVTYPALDADSIGQPAQIPGSFALAEGPLWDPCEGRLLFCEVQGDGGGVVHALGSDGQTSVFMTNTGMTSALAFDIDGSLIMTQMNPAHVVRRDASGTITSLEPRAANLHTPDDVAIRSDGTIYFSDGDFCPAGNLTGYLSTLPVYVMKPGASALERGGTVTGPNGIRFSPDEKILYVDGFGEGRVWAFDVAADGTLTKHSRPLATGLSNPDSLCLDAAGNLYVAVTSGIQVLRPDGSKVKLISIPSLPGACLISGVTNCTFGGDDGKTLYITTWSGLWKIEGMPIPGLDWVVNQERARCP